MFISSGLIFFQVFLNNISISNLGDKVANLFKVQNMLIISILLVRIMNSSKLFYFSQEMQSNLKFGSSLSTSII